MDSPPDALWRFSLAFYARPGVAEACLAAQDRHDKDVNILLYALWHGLSGRGRLNSDRFEIADRAVTPFRGGTIEPLRALRRQTKNEPGADALYRALKAAELEAERVVHNRLAALALPVTVADAGIRLADAEANLAQYLGPGTPADIGTALRLALRNEAAKPS